MLKQLFCWLWCGHEKRYLYTQLPYLNKEHAWICIRCKKTGISQVKIPKNYIEHESIKPKLNIVEFKND